MRRVLLVLRGISILSASKVALAWAVFRGSGNSNPSCHHRSIQSVVYAKKPQVRRYSVSSLLGKVKYLFRNGQGVDDSMTDYSEIVDDFGRGALEKKQSEGSHEDGDFQLIRLEKGLDTLALQDIATRDDVVNKISDVRLEQSRYGCADLYPREWQRRWMTIMDNNVDERIDRINGDVNQVELLKEPQPVTRNGYHEPQSLPISAVDGNDVDETSGDNDATTNNDAATFTAMQFNALAEGLSAGPQSIKPFNKLDADNKVTPKEDSKKGGYGGFTSLPHPNVVLDFCRRRWRLIEVMVGSNGQAPFDILALQEIDRFYGFFAPILDLFGYDGLFVPKPKSPGVRMGWYSDGCALFWKRHVFELVCERRDSYSVGNQVFVVAALRHRRTQQVIVVAVTHLKAQRSEANEWTRCRQVEELLAAVDDEALRVVNSDDDNAGSVPIIVLGDFNADPPSTNQDFKESAIDHLLAHDLTTAGGRSLRDKEPVKRHQSAYRISHDAQDGFYTSWKIRGSTATKRIIDYIFYHGGCQGRRHGTEKATEATATAQLQCIATLQVPSGDLLELTKLPGLRYPSDHVHIAAQFEIRPARRIRN